MSDGIKKYKKKKKPTGIIESDRGKEKKQTFL